MGCAELESSLALALQVNATHFTSNKLLRLQDLRQSAAARNQRPAGVNRRQWVEGT